MPESPNRWIDGNRPLQLCSSIDCAEPTKSMCDRSIRRISIRTVFVNVNTFRRFFEWTNRWWSEKWGHKMENNIFIIIHLVAIEAKIMQTRRKNARMIGKQNERHSHHSCVNLALPTICSTLQDIWRHYCWLVCNLYCWNVSIYCSHVPMPRHHFPLSNRTKKHLFPWGSVKIGGNSKSNSLWWSNCVRGRAHAQFPIKLRLCFPQFCNNSLAQTEMKLENPPDNHLKCLWDFYR